MIRMFLVLCAVSGFALTSKAQTNVCGGDSVCFDAGSFRGNIQWYASEDGGPYDVINGATTSPWCVAPPTGHTFMVFGAITEGTCDTLRTDTLTFIVGVPLSASNAVPNTLITACGSSATIADSLHVTGGFPPYTYAWSPATDLSATNVANPMFTASTAGSFDYTVTVTDGNGCTTTSMVNVLVDPQGVVSYNFTGGIQTFTVPACVDTVFIQTWGGQGGAGATGGNSATGGAGGLGGYAEGWLLVNPGDVINVFVGGQGATPTGGFNGGANGGSQNAGGGGGASDVRVGGTAEANRVIVAGGGGGGGRAGCETNTVAGGAGGSGGGGVGANGTDAPTSGGVAGGGKGGNFGGTQGLNGAAGTGCSGFLGSAGTTATTGTGGSGGAGQSCCCFTFGSIPGGGGGGGGFLGGGGGGGGSAGTTGCSGNDKGAGGGGGGGSSYTGGVLSGATNNGIWLGNGMVTISW